MMSNRQYHVYIATNTRNTVLYTGITNDIEKRMWEHNNKITGGFTARYNITKLVWNEPFDNPEDAIATEKKIKGWTRTKKMALIKKSNHEFRDLSK